jgi:hypothetical protein
MAPPALGAKVVTTVVLGAVGAGVFMGVESDGRGETPGEPAPIVEQPPTTSRASSSPTAATSGGPSTSLAAQPADPAPAPTRVRVRSGGS